MDISEGNAGERPSGSKAAPSSFRRPSSSDSRRQYVVESRGHGTARPVLTIMLDGPFLSYGVNSKLCRVLSVDDVAAILKTVTEILGGKRG